MTDSLNFGIFQMPEVRPGRNWNLYFHQIVDEAKLAEDLGFDEYWVGEHHTKAHETVPDPIMMLAHIAQATDRIRLGPATVNLTYNINDPFNIAERLAFLDQLSDGRANYGFGAGALPRDMEMFNIEHDRGKRIMYEAIDVIEQYTHATEPTDFDGEFFEYEDHIIQLPPLQEDPPTAQAGFTSAGSYENAVRDGHRPLSIAFHMLDQSDNPAAIGLREIKQTIVETAEEVGRDPQEALNQWGFGRDVYVAETTEQAYEDVREDAEEYFDYMLGLGADEESEGLTQFVKNHPDQTREDLTVDYLIENLPMLIGSPEDVTRQLKALHDEFEFGTLIINSHDWNLPENKWRDSLELFAQEVMPKFQPRKGPLEHEKQQLDNYEPVQVPDENPFGIDL